MPSVNRQFVSLAAEMAFLASRWTTIASMIAVAEWPPPVTLRAWFAGDRQFATVVCPNNAELQWPNLEGGEQNPATFAVVSKLVKRVRR